MTRIARPIPLVIIVIVLMVGSWMASALVGYLSLNLGTPIQLVLSQIANVVPNVVMFGCMCWLINRRGNTSPITWIVPLLLLLPLICFRLVGLLQLTSHAAIAEYGYRSLSYLVISGLGIFTLSRAVRLALCRIEATEFVYVPPLTIWKILLIGTVVAVIVAAGRSISIWAKEDGFGVNGMQYEVSLVSQFLGTVADATIFVGTIWLLYSSRQRFLGLIALFLWLTIQGANLGYVIYVFGMETKIGGSNITISYPMFYACAMVLQLGNLLIIPYLRVFGYAFKVVDAPQSNPSVETTPSPFDNPEEVSTV